MICVICLKTASSTPTAVNFVAAPIWLPSNRRYSTCWSISSATGSAWSARTTASIGFQLGAQARSVIIIFVTPEALENFRRVYGWKVGVDGSVALITVGIGGSIDTSKIASPIVGFIFDNKGLMYNLTLEGSKITRISR